MATVAVAVATGCGGDDGGGGSGGGSAPAGGPEGAQAFIGCSDAPGYEAEKPGPREESLFANTARAKGYANTPVNVSASVFLVFFDSEDKATEALDDLGRTSLGDVPPQQRGPAVIGYFSEEDKRKTEGAIDGCLK